MTNFSDVEFTMKAWVDWFNHRRLHSTLGMLAPTEVEAGALPPDLGHGG